MDARCKLTVCRFRLRSLSRRKVRRGAVRRPVLAGDKAAEIRDGPISVLGRLSGQEDEYQGKGVYEISHRERRLPRT
jgi:hypothetical protein